MESTDQSDTKIEFIENSTNEEFNKNVCMPYFKDIYKVII